MADFRPLVLDGTQIEELNESSDRLLVRDMVSTFDSNDKLHFTANDIRATLNNGARLIIEDTQTSLLSKTAADCKVSMMAVSENEDAILSLGFLTDQNECVFNYNPSPSDGTADEDKNKKLTVMLEGQGTESKQVVGIQTNLIGIGTHYRSAVVIPSRGNSAGNEGTKLTTYYETKGICNFSEVGTDVDAAALQLGLGLSIIKGGDNQTGPTIEFIKTRGTPLHGLTQSQFNALDAPNINDTLGQIVAGGTVGAGTSNAPISATMAFKANRGWTNSSPFKRGAWVTFEVQEYYGDVIRNPLRIGKEEGTSDQVGGKTIQLPLLAGSNADANTVGSGANLVIDTDASGEGNVLRASSSRKYKKNITDVSLDQCQNIVNNLRPVSFVYKTQNNQQYGLIAEEVEEVDPIMCIFAGEEVESVNYNSLSVMLLKVVRDQQAQITALETRIAALEG